MRQTARLFLLIAIPVVWHSSASQTLGPDFGVLNGPVYATAMSGDTLYVGGEFSYSGAFTGSATFVDTSSGTAVAGFPEVLGYVSSIVSDGAGGFFIGGSFTEVDGTSRNGLAHVKSDMSLDADWDPNPDAEVYSIERSGTTLFVGGSFGSIGDSSRSFLAAVSTVTGLANGWSPEPDGDIERIRLSGDNVFVAGWFTTIGGVAREYLAALNATSGVATDFAPAPDGQVYDFLLLESKVYAVGEFLEIGGQPRNSIASLDTSTGVASAWDPNPDDIPGVIASSGEFIYVAGDFTEIGGEFRAGLAALDTSDGTAISWDPGIDGYVFGLYYIDGRLYVFGDYETIAGVSRSGSASLDPGTGSAYDWTFPNSDAPPYVVAQSGSDLIVGGDFSSVGGSVRNRLAGFNVLTGELTAWNPDVLGTLSALKISGETIYIGGFITEVGGQSRNGLASIDLATGAVSSWNPNVNGEVRTIDLSGSTVYIGGAFTTVGDSTRNKIAAVDASTGLATAWNPDADNNVNKVVVSGSVVYAGGQFNTIGDSSRAVVAALDISTGAATAWNPDPNGQVFDIEVDGTKVYICGGFTQIDGVSYNRLSVIDASTGEATGWNPSASHPTYDIVVSGATVYASGNFSSVNGVSRARLAAIDTGLAATILDWDPSPTSVVNDFALDYDNQMVYLGGSFSEIFGSQRRYLAAITNPEDGSLPVQMSALSAEPLDFARSRGVVLRWNTLTEVDNAGWEIERKEMFNDERGTAEFRTIGFVEGAGTSTSPNEYRFEDQPLSASRLAYRLKQLDRSGSFSYSRVIEVSLSVTAPRVFHLSQNFPNPFNPSTTISYTLEADGPVTLKVYDLIGREVAALVNEEQKAGVFHEVSFEASSLASGVYFSRLASGGKQMIRRLVLVK